MLQELMLSSLGEVRVLKVQRSSEAIKKHWDSVGSTSVFEVLTFVIY